jgi:hypothetical protein
LEEGGVGIGTGIMIVEIEIEEEIGTGTEGNGDMIVGTVVEIEILMMAEIAMMEEIEEEEEIEIIVVNGHMGEEITVVQQVVDVRYPQGMEVEAVETIHQCQAAMVIEMATA